MLAGDQDARLMLAFQNGDDSAFDALFRRWAVPILRYVSRLVPDVGTAEELTQEVFIRVVKARERYVAEAKFSTWLYRIATNVALNELRRPQRKAAHESIEDGAGGWSRAAGGPSVDELIDARRTGQRFQAALAGLPERQRAALYLVAVEGFSYAEVAESLDATDKSVKALVHRARSTLAERMGPDG